MTWTRRTAAVVFAVAVLLGVVLGAVLHTSRPVAGATEVGTTAEPTTAAAAAERAEETAASSPTLLGSAEDSLPLGTPDPDAPVGPQPLPETEVVPVSVQIPAIDVDTALEDLERDESGVLQPPVVPESAGWFTAGTVPGERGPAVIAGHVDSGVAGAVFRDLDELRPGDEILVEMSDGEILTFVMDRSAVVPQAQFPSTQVYGPVPEPQLRLITCHTFDDGSRRYVDNLVVFATVS